MVKLYISWYEQRTVAITQETEVVSERIVIYLAPVALDEGRHQQQQGALGLMEVGHDALHDVERVARCYHDLRVGVQRRQVVAVKVVQYLLQCLQRGEAVVLLLVGHPLRHAELLLRSIGTLADEHTYII